MRARINPAESVAIELCGSVESCRGYCPFGCGRWMAFYSSSLESSLAVISAPWPCADRLVSGFSEPPDY